MLVVGGDSEELQRQFRAAGIEASVFTGLNDLPAALAQNGEVSRAGVAIWFYPRDDANDDRAVQGLLSAAESVLLVPEPGSDAAKPTRIT